MTQLIPQDLMREAARLAREAASRPREVICPSCGTQTSVRGRGKYCSTRCKQKAYRIRQGSKSSGG